MAEKSSFASRIHFGDFQSDPYAILETAYAALNFSSSESFSMTVLEASGAGLPVVATNCGVPAEIIQECKTGYLIPVGDVDAAAERIWMLGQHPEVACALGQAGAEHIEKTFSHVTYRQQLESVLTI